MITIFNGISGVGKTCALLKKQTPYLNVGLLGNTKKLTTEEIIAALEPFLAQESDTFSIDSLDRVNLEVEETVIEYLVSKNLNADITVVAGQEYPGLAFTKLECSLLNPALQDIREQYRDFETNNAWRTRQYNYGILPRTLVATIKTEICYRNLGYSVEKAQAETFRNFVDNYQRMMSCIVPAEELRTTNHCEELSETTKQLFMRYGLIHAYLPGTERRYSWPSAVLVAWQYLKGDS